MDVGVIGTGVMGRNHVRVYSELKTVGSVGVFDVNSRAAEEMARQHGAVAYPSIDRILDACDAVSVCIPTQFHMGTVRQVFEAGVPVLIEKPICTTSAEAESLLASAPRGITIGVGHIERFNPIVGEIKKIVKDPLYIDMKRHNPASARVTGGTVVEDLMIHDIDVLISLFGKPEGIHSAGSPDVCSVLARCGKVPVSLSASRKASKKIRMIYIETDECTVEGDFMTQEVTIYRKPGQYLFEAERYVQENIIEKVMVNKLEPLKRELATFVECVEAKKPFPVTPEQAVENLMVCEAVLAGLR